MTTPVSPASPTSASASSTSAGQAQNSHTGARGHGAARQDLFAQLMLLMGSDTGTIATAAPDALATPDHTPMPLTGESSADAQASELGAPQLNPLAGLLAWHDLPAVTTPTAGKLPTAGAAAGTTMGIPLDKPVLRAGPQPAAGKTADADARTEGLSLRGFTEIKPMESPLSADQAVAAGLAPNGSPAIAGQQNVRSRAPVSIVTAGIGGRGTTSPVSAAASASLSAPSSATGMVNSGRVQVLQSSGESPAASTSARSTVMLDDRFALEAAQRQSASASEDAPLPGSRAATTERQLVMGAADTAVTAAGESAGAGAGSHHGHDHPQPSPHEGEGSPMQAGNDKAMAEPAAWNAQQLHRASLRLDGEDAQSIDIHLAMQGQEVQVEFRTDDAAARQGLSQASAGLGDLLQRSGIDLGGVSVGAQNASEQQARQAPQQTSAGGASNRAREQGPVETPPKAPERPRSDGSRPLDLFV